MARRDAFGLLQYLVALEHVPGQVSEQVEGKTGLGDMVQPFVSRCCAVSARGVFGTLYFALALLRLGQRHFGADPLHPLDRKQALEQQEFALVSHGSKPDR